jgi:tRNA(fMet)-specific endonuclease VapC
MRSRSIVPGWTDCSIDPLPDGCQRGHRIADDPGGAVSRRARSKAPVEIGLSVIAIHELGFRAFRSRRRERNLKLVDRLFFEAVPFEQEDGRQAGEIRAALAARGLPIGPYDVLITGQARARDLPLVTANTGEFSRVDGLAVEDWTAP